MDKKSVLFVVDKDTEYKFKKDFLNNTLFNMSVIGGFEKALRSIAQKNFHVIVCDLEDVEEELNLLNKVKDLHPWVKTIAIANCPLDEFLGKSFNRPANFNIIGGNRPLDSKELRVTIEKLFTEDIFGINKYLPKKSKAIECTLKDSDHKNECINKVAQFITKFNQDQRLIGKISDIADEFLMNALYDAPRNEKGEFLYAHLDRNQRVALDKPINLKCTYNSRYLAVSVTDPYGSLAKGKFLSHLIDCISKSDSQVVIKPGGSGVGVYTILENLSSFIINLHPGLKTEVIGIIDLKWPMREFQKRYKSFHIFANEEEIKMTEELRVTREDLEDVLMVTFKGVLDESTYLGKIFDTDKKKISIDTKDVVRINSCGIREWVNAIKDIPSDRQIEFVNTSMPMVKQFNMITNFGGQGKVLSFNAPYYCPKCNEQFKKMIVINDHLESLLDYKAPDFVCSGCGSKLEFDDLEDRYFQFIIRQESA